MSTMRLTIGMRNAITRRAVDAAYAQREEELNRLGEALAVEAIAATMTKAELDAIDALVAISPRWLTESDYISFNAEGYRIDIRTTKMLIVPADDKPFPVTGVLSQKMRDFANRLETIRTEKKKHFKELQALLNTCSTIKALEIAWPEGKPFYQQYQGDKPALPAVQFTDINKALGLPLEEAA